MNCRLMLANKVRQATSSGVPRRFMRAALAAAATAESGSINVDAIDLAQWQEDYGDNADSDAADDGDSDGADYLSWQRNLHPANGVAPITSVPEPAFATTIMLYLTSSAIFSTVPYVTKSPSQNSGNAESIVGERECNIARLLSDFSSSELSTALFNR